MNRLLKKKLLVTLGKTKKNVFLFGISLDLHYLCSHETENRTDIPVTAGQRAGQPAVGLCGVLYSPYDLFGRELEPLCRQSVVAASDGDVARWTDVRHHGDTLYKRLVGGDGAVSSALERNEDLPRGVPLGICGHQYIDADCQPRRHGDRTDVARPATTHTSYAERCKTQQGHQQSQCTPAPIHLFAQCAGLNIQSPQSPSHQTCQ